MRIGLQTWGTDGDILPFLALANGLQRAGHQVMIAYTSVDGKSYENHQNAKGIRTLAAFSEEHLSQKSPYDLSIKPGSLKEFSKLLEFFYEPHTQAMWRVSEKLCQESDLLIGHAVCHTLHTAAQKHGVPRIALHLCPQGVPSMHFAPSGRDLGVFINSFLWKVGDIVTTWRWFRVGRSIREGEGMPRIRSLQRELFASERMTILASSEALLPPAKALPANVHITGPLRQEETVEEMLSDRLMAFLDSGEPPVYMTFGSCMPFNEVTSVQLLTKAAELAGCRAIIQSNGPGGDRSLSSQIHFLSQCSHGAVFPKCAIVVHHGGAGTTQSTLLAGKPSVVVAHGFDQPYWGSKLNDAGVAARTLDRRTVTPSTLAKEIRVVLDSPEMTRRASALGRRMRQENGVARCVELIQGLRT